MPDLHQEIAELEAEIERLWDTAERCRKIAIAAQVAIVGGGLLIVSVVTGLVRLDLMGFLVVVAVMLGGVVLLGSNRSTRGQIVARIRAQEAQRAEMIDALTPRVWPDKE